MSWDKARNSADLLAERLNRIDGVSQLAQSPQTTPPSLPVYTKIPAGAALDTGIGAANQVAADAEACREGDAVIDDDRRIDPRTAQQLNASIAIPGRTDALPARIVDMSVSGARIELQDHEAAADLPGRFVLVLHRDRSEVDCQIIWRTHAYIGALFLATPKSISDRA